jgi:hypothetical protein
VRDGVTDNDNPQVIIETPGKQPLPRSLSASGNQAESSSEPSSKPSSRRGTRHTVTSSAPAPAPVDILADEVDQEPDDIEDVPQNDGEEETAEFAIQQSWEAEGHNAEMSRKLSDLTTRSSGAALAPVSSNMPSVLQLIYALLAIVALAAVGSYKSHSAAIGYCDANADSNEFLDHLRTQRRFVHECNARLIANGPDMPDTRLVDGVHCPLDSLWPILPPDTCTPCPKRATCYWHAVNCDGAFILQDHPAKNILRFGADKIFDGLLGFGSVAFPPQCVEDRQRLKQLVGMEKGIERWLAQIKGDKICKGEARSENGGGDAKAWGVPLTDVRRKVQPLLNVRTLPCQYWMIGSLTCTLR